MSKKALQVPLRLRDFLESNKREFLSQILSQMDEKLGEKVLFSYQIKAVQNAIKALSYYQEVGEDEYFESIYKNCGLSKVNSNQASFWMATGSGKTVVMVKLIKELFNTIKTGLIDDKPILILAPTQTILKQIQAELRNTNLEPKELNSNDLGQRSLFNNDVFLYRSDLLDDGQNTAKSKDGKRIDFHDYLLGSGWYVFLDEAHRGDSDDSKRKEYIRNLCVGKSGKKGFIFNFSATFTDEIDLLTCAYEYNLRRFNTDGYGKQIALFKDDLEINSDEESRVFQVLKSFLIFAMIKKSKERLKDATLNYHNPLMIAVSDKVNTQDAGIKIYFKAVKKILENNFNLDELKKNLKTELAALRLEFSDECLNSFFIDLLDSINQEQMKQYIFHDSLANSLEACKISSNQREIVVKSKNSHEPFLLVNIGDTKEWSNFLSDELDISVGAELSRGYFDSINEPKSPINIMLGSKVFSEGWDSNRVNEILFLNIGSKNAIKYVSQTIGRGIRIEPSKGDKKRRGNKGIETLFVLASDSAGVAQVLQGFKAMQNEANLLKGFKKTSTYKEPKIPVYKDNGTKEVIKLSNNDALKINKYLREFDSDVLYFYEDLCDEAGVRLISELKNDDSRFFKKGFNVDFFGANVSLKRLLAAFKSSAKKLDGFKALNDEIRHFNDFHTTLGDEIVKKINAKIKEVLKSVDKKIYNDNELIKMLESGEISAAKMLEIKNEKILNEIIESDYQISAKLQKHYYLPVIKRQDDEQINHSIKVPSEIEFLSDLEANYDKCFCDYEWSFSKIAENVDEIFIPYFDSQTQNYKKFYPDFIFWLRSSSGDESMYFIDPKGLRHEQNARDKIKGFLDIFSKNGVQHQGIRVYLYYYNRSNCPDGMADFVKGSVIDIFKNKRI